MHCLYTALFKTRQDFMFNCYPVYLDNKKTGSIVRITRLGVECAELMVILPDTIRDYSIIFDGNKFKLASPDYVPEFRLKRVERAGSSTVER